MEVISIQSKVLSSLSKNSEGLPKVPVECDLVVEWRGLTVALLDVVGQRVRERLGLNEEEFPLVKVLEAGKARITHLNLLSYPLLLPNISSRLCLLRVCEIKMKENLILAAWRPYS